MTYPNHAAGGFTVHLLMGELVFMVLNLFLDVNIFVKGLILATFAGMGAMIAIIPDVVWGVYKHLGLDFGSLYGDFHEGGPIFERFGKYFPAWYDHIARDYFVHDPVLPNSYIQIKLFLGISLRDLIWTVYEILWWVYYFFIVYIVILNLILRPYMHLGFWVILALPILAVHVYTIIRRR